MGGMEDTVRVTSGVRSPEQLRTWLRSLLTLVPAIRRLMADDTYRGIAEALAGVLCLTVLGVVIHGHWGLLDVQPHPFWILVIAIAMRYGAAPGYVAAGVASACYAFFIWVGPGLHLQSPNIRELAQLFFLLAGGMIVSELVRSQHRYLTTLKQHSAGTDATLHDLIQRQQAFDKVNTELEKRLITQSSSLIALYGIAKQLNVLEVQHVYAAIPVVMAEVFEAEACAIYEWREGRLELRAGAPSHLPGRKDTWDLETGLIGRAFRDARVITVRERLIHEGVDAIEEEPAMLAGPLLDRDGQPVGVVVVERLPFLKLNTAGLRLFETCLDWFSASLVNAEEYQEALRRAPSAGLDGHEGTESAATESAATENAATGAHPASRILSRLREECARARSELTPVSVMFVQITERALALPGLEAELRRVLGLTFGRRLRQEDVARKLADRKKILLILPRMSGDGARALSNRIAADLRARGLNNEKMLAVVFGVATLLGEEARPECLLDAAVADARTNVVRMCRQRGGMGRHTNQKRKPRSRRKH